MRRVDLLCALVLAGAALVGSTVVGHCAQNRGPGLPNGEYTTELNGLKLWYRVAGSGPVCLMPTPAWGMSADLYFRTLKPLEERFTMVYLDSRGTGRSQRAAASTEYTWEHLVADLDALRVHLKQQKVWLMGHSEGGISVLHYACTYPGRVSGLVLLNTAAVFDEQQQRDTQARALLRRDQPWFAEAASTMGPTEFAADEEMKAAMQKGLPLFWSDVGKIAAHRAHFEATSYSAAAWRGQHASRRVPFDLTDRLKQVKAPALIVVGDDDFISSPAAAKRLHLGLRNSKLLLIEQSGHFPWLEQPQTFFAEIPRFLDALGNGTEGSRRPPSAR